MSIQNGFILSNTLAILRWLEMRERYVSAVSNRQSSMSFLVADSNPKHILVKEEQPKKIKL